MKRLIYLGLLLMSMLNAAIVEIDKEVYITNETIVASFSELEGQSSEWIAIYLAGSSNDFGNIIQWKLTNANVEGNVTFDGLNVGNYEVRHFNSANFVIAKQFSVEADPAIVTTVETTQTSYLVEEEIITVFDNMSGNTNDWIGIYPAGSSNDWENMLQWDWVEDGLLAGTHTFDPMPIGDYEVRVFFNNSLNSEASYAFSVEGPLGVSLVLNKEVYAQNELIYINYENMQGNNSDWIGIYPAGASYHFENVIDSKQTEGNINGEISLCGVDVLPDAENNPGGLAPGNYEVRAFYNNSLTAQTVTAFTVTEQAVTSTVYESADGAISPNWFHIAGPTAPYYNAGRVNLKPNWISNFTNTSDFRLVFPQVNTTQKVLEFDAGGVRWQPHFYMGVILETTEGTRKMIWDPFFNHEGTDAFKSGSYLSYPLYVDTQRESTRKIHVRLDVEKYLRILEPNNKVISISAFMASGGDFDEIELSSH